MKKSIFALSILTFLHLGAQEAQYHHQVSIHLTTSESPEYLAEFDLYKIIDEQGDSILVTSPKLMCKEGQEAEITGDGYTVKALVYKEGAKTKAKTLVEIQENDKVVYTDIQDRDIN